MFVFVLQIVNPDSGAHPVACSVGNGTHSLGINGAGSEADQLYQSGAEIKNEWSLIFTPLTSS
jgi:hypothetical protein